ncbi:hypothetical protein [Gardnerella sp. Marseille-Q2328]|uniref:hypothetical protein n=1 Tax=Gardnerella sp. Marseille-Q2328 TaxID=2759694 RepID=UPI0020248A12|nr:hypothetical protein [Gardnerella sp. Marseille-Q2328]
MEVPRTSNLSEFPLRVAFARYALSAKAGRRANPGEKDSSKCSIKAPKQLQKPGIFQQMFHKMADAATKAGNFPANVP